jgi:hypothetical protein
MDLERYGRNIAILKKITKLSNQKQLSWNIIKKKINGMKHFKCKCGGESAIVNGVIRCNADYGIHVTSLICEVCTRKICDPYTKVVLTVLCHKCEKQVVFDEYKRCRMRGWHVINCFCRECYEWRDNTQLIIRRIDNEILEGK